MLKEPQKKVAPSSVESEAACQVLVQLCTGDFERNEDGSWVVTKDIFVAGSADNQRLFQAGRVIRKNEINLIGLDLAAILEKHCPH